MFHHCFTNLTPQFCNVEANHQRLKGSEMLVTHFDSDFTRINFIDFTAKEEKTYFKFV